MFAEVGATVFVDDSLVYTQEVVVVRMSAILFYLRGSYRLNDCDAVALPPVVARATRWSDAVDHNLSITGTE